MSPARTPPRTARSGRERSNSEATATPLALEMALISTEEFIKLKGALIGRRENRIITATYFLPSLIRSSFQFTTNLEQNQGKSNESPAHTDRWVCGSVGLTLPPLRFKMTWRTRSTRDEVSNSMGRYALHFARFKDVDHLAGINFHPCKNPKGVHPPGSGCLKPLS